MHQDGEMSLFFLLVVRVGGFKGPSQGLVCDDGTEWFKLMREFAYIMFVFIQNFGLLCDE